MGGRQGCRILIMNEEILNKIHDKEDSLRRLNNKVVDLEESLAKKTRNLAEMREDLARKQAALAKMQEVFTECEELAERVGQLRQEKVDFVLNYQPVYSSEEYSPDLGSARKDADIEYRSTVSAMEKKVETAEAVLAAAHGRIMKLYYGKERV